MWWRTSKRILSPQEKLASSERQGLQDRFKARVGVRLGLKTGMAATSENRQDDQVIRRAEWSARKPHTPR